MCHAYTQEKLSDVRTCGLSRIFAKMAENLMPKGVVLRGEDPGK